MGRIKDAVLSVQQDKHHSTTIFVLPTNKDWTPHPETKERIEGPALVLVERAGIETTLHRYSLKDKRAWGWLERLVKAGTWALSNKAIFALLPDELVAYSPRFNGTTQPERARMQQTHSGPATKKKQAKKRV